MTEEMKIMPEPVTFASNRILQTQACNNGWRNSLDCTLGDLTFHDAVKEMKLGRESLIFCNSLRGVLHIVQGKIRINQHNASSNNPG
jgi:hypothetical protein